MDRRKTVRNVKKKKRKNKVFTAYNCDICSKQFSDKYALGKHKLIHSDETPYQCKLCEYAGKTRQYLRKHVRVKHGERKFECEVCKKLFHYDCHLKDHMRVHTGEKPNICAVCGKAFNSLYSLKTHKLIHANLKPYKCSYCPYACRDSSTLRKHQARHLGQVTYYSCTLCNVSFDKKDRLRVHIAEKHFDVDMKRLECDACGKLFRFRNTLVLHIQTVHDKSRTWKCSVCGFVLSNRANMRSHMRTHVDERPFVCSVEGCGKRFKCTSALGKHAIIHYPERHFPCKICDRRFARESRLIKHLKTHMAKVKEVECDYCHVRFYNTKYLTNHIRRKHGRKKKRYICDLCDFMTTNKPSIVMHIKYGHALDNALACTICEKQFKREFNLKLHYWTAHEVEYGVPTTTKKKCKKTGMTDVIVKDEPIDKDYNDGEYLEVSTKIEPLDEEGLEELTNIVPAPESGTELEIIPMNVTTKLEGIPKDMTSELEKIPKGMKNELVTFPKDMTSEIDDIPKDITIQLENTPKDMTSELENTPEDITIELENISEDMTSELENIPKDMTSELENTPKDITSELENIPEDMTSELENTPKDKTNELNDIPRGVINELEEIPQDVMNELEDIPKDMMEKFITPRLKRVEKKRLKYKRVDCVDEKSDERANKQVKDLLEERKQKIKEKKQKKANIALERTRQKYNMLVQKAVERIKEGKVKIKHINSKEQHPNSLLVENFSIKQTIDDTDCLRDEIHSDDIDEQGKDTTNEIETNEDTTKNNNEEDRIDNIEEREDNINNETKSRRNERKNYDENSVDTDMDDEAAPNENEKAEMPLGRNRKLTFNTHQCYVCFKLFQTKEQLLEHCKDHFDLCSMKTLKKCPICNYTTDLSITTHLKRKHKIKIKVPYGTFKNNKNSKGTGYYYEVNDDRIKTVEIIPSIKNLHKREINKLDKKNRENKNKDVVKPKLVKKGKEWIVLTEKVKINPKDYLLPKFDKLESKNFKADYVDSLKELYKIARKQGKKMIFPCDSCEKICQTLAALKLHGRKHETNPKPFKPKVWKHKLKGAKDNSSDPKTKRNKGTVNKDNRTAKPQPVVNKHKCDKELIEFYEQNIRGSDIEFWQFLKIYNKMGRDNINNFDDLQKSDQFGIHYNDPGESTSNNAARVENISKDVRDVSVKLVKNTDRVKNKKTVRNAFKRVVRLSKKEFMRRNEAKKRLRENIRNFNSQNNA